MKQETNSITTVLFKWLRNFLPSGLTWIGSLKKHITPMSLFPLTPDKLGPLICKRINRLTLFARAQKQGTHTVTRMQGRQVLIEDPPPDNSERELLFFCGAVQPLQVCRRHICDYDSHKAGRLIDYSDAISCASSGKGFSGLLFNGPGVSNKIRMCFSRATATRGGREKKRARQRLRVHKQRSYVDGARRPKIFE